MNKDIITKIEYLKYKKEYFRDYSSDERKFIKDNIFKDEEIMRVDLLAQICSKIGAFELNEDRYRKFVNLISEEFSLEGNIIEIGCGNFPIVSYHLSKIKTSKGTITAYDPRVITKPVENIKLVKEEFSYNTDLKPYNLVVGYFACDVTETIIKRACDEEKDFIVGLCGCTHFPRSYFLDGNIATKESWLDYLYNMAQKHKSSACDLSVKYLDDIDNYPIIEGKHKIKSTF